MHARAKIQDISQNSRALAANKGHRVFQKGKSPGSEIVATNGSIFALVAHVFYNTLKIQGL